MNNGTGIRVVGVRLGDGSVVVGILSDDNAEVAVLADLEAFWASPQEHLDGRPSGLTIPVVACELVPPVLKGARVVCVGLNYLDQRQRGIL